MMIQSIQIEHNTYQQQETMQNSEKQFIMSDIMKKRNRDQREIKNKLQNKVKLRGDRHKNKEKQVHQPEKYIKEYRAAQKSYAHYKHQNSKAHKYDQQQKINQHKQNLLIVVRIRGVKDISKQQKLCLNKLGLRRVNSAVFCRGDSLTMIKLHSIENYITWGQPNPQIIAQLIRKKMYAKIGTDRISINSNQLIEDHLAPQAICMQDIINQITNMGRNFNKIVNFIYPFKLTTASSTLMSQIRKPFIQGGHWGYRGYKINQYIENMI